MFSEKAPKKCFAHEQRRFKRIHVGMECSLMAETSSTVLVGWVIDISEHGARVRCRIPLRPETRVVLYIEKLGQFEGRTGRWEAGVVGVMFKCGDAKRRRLVAKLSELSLSIC